MVVRHVTERHIVTPKIRIYYAIVFISSVQQSPQIEDLWIKINIIVPAIITFLVLMLVNIFCAFHYASSYVWVLLNKVCLTWISMWFIGTECPGLVLGSTAKTIDKYKRNELFLDVHVLWLGNRWMAPVNVKASSSPKDNTLSFFFVHALLTKTVEL
jgi:hypothetical protein